MVRVMLIPWWRYLLLSEPAPCARCLLGNIFFECRDVLVAVFRHKVFYDISGALLGVLHLHLRFAHRNIAVSVCVRFFPLHRLLI